MKNIKSLLVIFGCLLATQITTVQGQNPERKKLFVGYEVAVPSGFISETSWSGVRVDYRTMVAQNFSFGIAASFNSFSQYFEKSTYQRPDGTGAVHGDMVRQMYSLPITLTGHYYFSQGSKINPYLGIGVGAQYNDQKVFMNVYNVPDYNWGVVARPELGITFPLKFGGLYLSAAYNIGSNKNEAFNIDHVGYLAFTAGFTFGAP